MNNIALRETSFTEQIAVMERVTELLRGQWIVQRFMFDEWRGITVAPIIPDNPISETWFPITGTCTYATSGEAVEAMLKMQSVAPNVPMRVAPVEEDILAAQLSAQTGQEQARYGKYPKWGQLLLRFPNLGLKKGLSKS